MRPELLILPYLTVLLWNGLYFSKEDFWNRLGSKPNWGNNQALFLVIYIIFTFLFFVSIYVAYSVNKDRNILLLYYIFIILILAIPYVMSQDPNRNEETFIFSIFLLIITIINMFTVTRKNIRDKINIFVILSLMIYLFIWFENMKDK